MRNKSGQSYELHRPEENIDRSRIFNAPGILLFLVGANVLIFILLGLLPRQLVYYIERGAALSPALFFAGPPANGGVLSMISPVFSHMFLHAGLAHLGMNMVSLLAFGAPVARRMGAEGATRSIPAFIAASVFVTFYLLAGVCGALLFASLHASSVIQLVGASGAISGVFGALVRFAFNRTSLRGPQYARISALGEPSVILWSSLFIGSNLMIAVGGGAFFGGNVAWEAHIGGFLFGLVTYPFFEKAALSWR